MIIVCSGMGCSGSTFLFNLLRVMLLQKYPKLVSGWEGDVEIPDGTYLVKTHSIFLWQHRSEHIFFTYRDIRVAAVSCLRKFGQSITMESIQRNVHEYTAAKMYGSRMFKYEDLISKPIPHIQSMMDLLGVQGSSEEICKEVASLELPQQGAYSPVTLLHYNHFTHSTLEDWKALVPVDFQEEVEDKFHWWFEECKYDIES